MPTTTDPYATLGIPPTASRDEAARAHRRLAKRFHPDVNRGPAAAERMRRINEAWRILSSASRRSRYDAEHPERPWPGPGHRAASGPGSWARSADAGRTGTAAWTTWPESRRSATVRTRRPARPEPVEPSFGDRPAVFVAVWVGLMLLFFVGSWLGATVR